MNAFTPSEVEYLQGQRLGRLATVGSDGQPHVIPVTFVYNEGEGSIDVGGIAFGQGKKWRDAKGHPKVTFLVDESNGKSAPAASRSIRSSRTSHRSSSGSARRGS
jgi:pyridoxamine 5'-phosphate oxidase family protein